MLSINIPVYNIDATHLVLQLHKQVKKHNIQAEIRVYDDASKAEIQKKNRAVKKLENVVYREMDKNMGRAAIRNKMGFESAHNYLLFIDADSKIISGNYLSHYLRYAQPGVVICGGTTYSKKKPNDPEKLLRWVYGRKREAIPAQQKNRNKGFIITSNNFLIEKKVFERVHFREDIKKYGHEDTMLGFDLSENNYKIVHFDNPVEHTGLENSAVFLNKSKLALGNLFFIATQLAGNKKAFWGQVNFLKKYYQITRYIPEKLLQFLFWKFEHKMEKNLLGKSPGMRIFDLYKLGYFATLKNREL